MQRSELCEQFFLRQQVWYHGEWCSSRGRNCNNTKLTDSGGCCIWYNEPQYLGDIEEHLGVTIQQIENEMKIAVDEFDGKVVYGAKRKDTGSGKYLQLRRFCRVSGGGGVGGR
jgi:hypothetical protein